MLDARFAAFAGLSALLVISPGATLAVVVETALASGRRAALLTVLGVGVANATLAAAAAVGLSAAFSRWPSALDGVRLAGGAYLVYLGARGLWGALTSSRPAPEGPTPFEKKPGPMSDDLSSVPQGGVAEAAPAACSRAFVARGVLTNLLNPPVLLFYVTVVPQFIGPQDRYLARALALGTTHVAMSVAWQGTCGVAVGLAAEHMARPAVRRSLEAVTGLVLVFLGARLVL